MNLEFGSNRNKICSFMDLDAWKEGHELVLMVYKVTSTFPKGELFGLVSQMRRAVVSITSNIAEGFSRQSYREKVQFYSIAAGSVTELQNQSVISRDVGFLTNDDHQRMLNQSIKVHKILNGLMKHSRTHVDS